jgi:hypothetical protein
VSAEPHGRDEAPPGDAPLTEAPLADAFGVDAAEVRRAVLAAWDALHADHGFPASDSTVAATVIRSVLHVETRHSTAPEQLAHDFADSLRRTAALVRPVAAGYIVLNPEHARLCDRHGWSKADLSRAIYELGVKRYGELRQTGKEAIAAGTNWRLPAGHPDALPHTVLPDEEPVRLIAGPEAVHIVVAGAPNAGVPRSSRRSPGWMARQPSGRSSRPPLRPNLPASSFSLHPPPHTSTPLTPGDPQCPRKARKISGTRCSSYATC